MDDRLKHAEEHSRKAHDPKSHRLAGDLFLKIAESAKSDEEAAEYVAKAKAHHAKASPVVTWARRLA